MKICVSAAIVLSAATLASNAGAAFTITQSAVAAPTYSNLLTFDAPGTPTGEVPSDSWTSYGISAIYTGENAAASFVTQANTTPGYGWLGTGNVCAGAYGVYMKFSSEVSQLSAQYWDDSGPGSFFGGGAAIVLLKGDVEVGSLFINSPAFSPTAKPWFNITGGAGETFDEIRFVGFGFFPTAYIDNVSWTSVPSPAGACLLGLAGLMGTRRRR
ncbi:MAG: hypothetical protein U0570_00820 [Phycisphaerales bacterium]